MIPNARILGIASRSREKAEGSLCKAMPYSQGDTNAVYNSYDALLADPEIDTVSGKRVLCEKPLPANEARAPQKELRAINATRSASNLPQLHLYEEFHTLSHTLSGRLRQLLREHVLNVNGATVRNVMPVRFFGESDILYDAELAGGEAEGVEYRAKKVGKGVDEGMKFRLEFEKEGKNVNLDAMVSFNEPAHSGSDVGYRDDCGGGWDE
ncbi:hypothetical protein BJ742DRAFT_775050 [Cladochytrium replicatum]|nr:hypothetical protein BJ742DRAFT_775050 [Cladochytrium replicatum]